MKLYVVTRRDLPTGLAASQMIHAAREFRAQFPVLEECWHSSSNTVVLVTVEDRLGLSMIAARATDKDVCFASFYEPDLGGERTAIAFVAENGNLVRNLPTFA